MSIIAKNITKTFGLQKALDGVSFEIKAGEVAGFLGPNGAGKTTMMRILTCFIPPASGDAFVSGYDISYDSIEVRKQVGYLPENNPLYPEMYVKEYLHFIAGIYKIRDSKIKVEEMVELTGLQREKNKKIGALSKGFRQRVGLAQVLIHNPPVLILDEPTSGLDPNQLDEIRALIKQIGKEKTVLLSTHIMQEVAAVCSRVIIINKGKIVADNAADDLRAKAGGNTIITVEFDKPVNRDGLAKIRGVKNLKPVRGNMWQIESGDDTDIRSGIFQFAVHQGLTVLTIKKESTSLEDIFRELTR